MDIFSSGLVRLFAMAVPSNPGRQFFSPRFPPLAIEPVFSDCERFFLVYKKKLRPQNVWIAILLQQRGNPPRSCFFIILTARKERSRLRPLNLSFSSPSRSVVPIILRCRFHARTMGVVDDPSHCFGSPPRWSYWHPRLSVLFIVVPSRPRHHRRHRTRRRRCSP